MRYRVFEFLAVLLVKMLLPKRPAYCRHRFQNMDAAEMTIEAQSAMIRDLMRRLHG